MKPVYQMILKAIFAYPQKTGIGRWKGIENEYGRDSKKG